MWFGGKPTYIDGKLPFGNRYFMVLRSSRLFVVFLMLAVFAAAGCAGACGPFAAQKRQTVYKFPSRSFVQVKNVTIWEGCAFNADLEKKICETAQSKATSSGSFIRHSKIDKTLSYVLTAGHSCRDTKAPTTQQGQFTVRHAGQIFSVVDYDGFEYEAEVLEIDSRFDLCLMGVRTVLMKPPVLRVAKLHPVRGEVVFNMAAPHGIIAPRMVLTFSGFFTGYSQEGFSVFSIPTRPGSSGSPIINASNELVSSTFAGYHFMENVAVASPLRAVKTFLRKSVANAEMNNWIEKNKLLGKVDILPSKMLEKIGKELDEYFHVHAVENQEATATF